MADITQESGVCSILKRGNLHFIGCGPLIIPPLGTINGHIYLCCTLVLCGLFFVIEIGRLKHQ